MTRKDYKDDQTEMERLDAVNEERYESTKKRVTHAINLLKQWNWRNNIDAETLINDVAHAVNLIESAVEDMTFHCEWFDYDTSICLQLDEVCIDLAYVMTEPSAEACILKGYISDALIKLSKVYATLIRWNDVSVDRSEV